MNRRRLGWVSVVSSVLMVCGLSTPAHCQSDAALSGSVQDQTGAALSAVTIVLSQKGVVAREARTDSAGMFQISNVSPGEYDVTAALSGFDTTQRSVRLQPGATASLSLTLSLRVREEVMVTAAKTGAAVDIQSLPMAISAASNAELTRLAIRTIEQAVPLLPSVTFTQNATFGQLSIRGIGSNVPFAGSDPSSAMYIDGVYLARPGMVFADLLDVERIEVVRGPQGTLYGRNAVGGALNLISKVPTNEADASARLTGGNFGELRADLRLSGPLKRERVMGSVSFARGVRDGYVRDVDHPDHPLGGDDLIAARGQMRVVVGRGSDLLVSSDVNNQRADPLAYNKVLQVKPGFTVDNPSDLRSVRTSTLASGRILQYGTSARLTMRPTPSTTLVSLAAFRALANEYLADADITELDLLSARNRERQHQWSEELTLSHRRNRSSWIAGAFFFNEDDHQTIWVDQPPSSVQVFRDPRVDSNSSAAFGQTTFDLTSRLSGTIGLRYTREQKTIDNSGGLYPFSTPGAPVPGSAYSYKDSIAYTAWTPKAGVELKLPGQGIAYVSATRGFKSGGFNLSSTQPGRGFAPEWAWSYEAGVKTELMNRRTRVNAAAFSMDYTNLQVQTPIGIGVYDIRNAAAATIRGVEVEGAARLGRSFDAGGHVTWLDATYDRYVAVTLDGTTGDVAGHRLNNAPEWAGRLWAEWKSSLASAHLLTLTVDATAQSTVFFTPFNDDVQRQLPYALLGARAEYGPSNRRWSINVYARNALSADYIMATFATSPAAYGGRPGAPRQFAVQLELRR